MSQPVKLSDALVSDARLAGEIVERSISGLKLRRHSAARPLSECLESVDTPEGRQRVADFLENQAFPHYEPAPDRPACSYALMLTAKE